MGVPHVSRFLRDVGIPAETWATRPLIPGQVQPSKCLGFRADRCSHVTDNPGRFSCPQPMAQALHRFYGGRDLHSLTFSCYQRQPLLADAARCDLFLKILERVRLRYRLVVLGYVVMPEHVHLLVSEPQRATLSTAIQALKLGVVRSLQVSGGGTVAATAPMSRKSGETWAPPVQMVQKNRIASGRHGSTISMFGRKRSESKSCATSIATLGPGTGGFAGAVAVEQFSLVLLGRGRPSEDQRDGYSGDDNPPAGGVIGWFADSSKQNGVPHVSPLLRDMGIGARDLGLPPTPHRLGV